MTGPPTGLFTRCPECDAEAVAILPYESGRLVDREEDGDGMVWVNCADCGARFRRYYRIDE